MLRVHYIWKGVTLPAGDHEVEFRYFSPVLAWARGGGGWWGWWWLSAWWWRGGAAAAGKLTKGWG